MYCLSDAVLWLCTHEFTSNNEWVHAIFSTYKYDIEDKVKKNNKNIESEMTLIP